MMTDKKINLLVLLRDYPVGLAVTKKIHNLIIYLHDQGSDIKVLGYRSKFDQPVFNVKRDPIPFINIGNQLRLSNLWKTWRYYSRGLKVISDTRKPGRDNIFYCIGPVNVENLLFIVWAKAKRYKVLFDVNEDYSVFEDKVKIISRLKIATTRMLDVLTYRWATAITVVSSHLKEKYERRGDKPVILIPVTAANNLMVGKIDDRSGFKVVYAGTFDLKDGVRNIIEGFLMFRSANREAELILIGKSEQQAGYAKEYLQYQEILFKGYVPDSQFYELLRDADALCMCRTNSDFSNAGFPFKLGEYLATGNPVISTRASDVSRYLTPDDVYMVDFDSPTEIAAALDAIAGDPAEAKRVGQNGYQRYLTYFSPESNGRLLIELLQQI